MPKPGGKIRVDCDACNTEFEVVLEPKVAEGIAQPGTMPAQKVQYCPFCAADVSSDEDD